MYSLTKIFYNFKKEYSNFNITIKKMILANALSSIGSGIFSFLFIFYVINTGFSTVVYGLLSSITGITYILFILPVGIISSRLGSKKMIIFGNMLGIISIIFYILSNNIFLFYSGSIIYGISGAFSNPNFNSILSKASEEHRRNFVFSLNGFLNLMGSTIGIVLSGYFPALGSKLFNSDEIGFKIALTITAILWIGTLITITSVKEDIKLKRNEKINIPKNVLKTMIKLTIPASLIGLGAGFVIPYFQVQFQDRFHLSISTISYIFSITTFSMAIIMLIVPFLARRKGTLTTIVSFQLIAAVLLFTMPFTSNLKNFGLLIFSGLYYLRTILMNVAGPIQSSFELSMVPEIYRPVMSSLVSLSWVGMNSVSVYLGGIIMQYSLNLPFYICTAFYITSSVLYFIFFKDLVKKFL